tara:strand:+ start:949 stop:3444 length:2496 start_codon:yes stop_codon:yes gene_type:complete
MSEVTVRFRGDTRQLDRALGGVNRGLKRVNQNAKASRKSLKSISDTGNRVTTALRAAGAALLAFGAGSLIKNIVNVSTRFEDLRTTLSSVTGSAKSGAEAFKFVSEFSTKTQFGIEELTQSYIKLKAAGIEPTEQLLTTFTNTAAITTDQLGSLQAVTDLFARTTAGGLGLEEIERLGDRGVPVLDILREKLGLSRNEISEFGKTAEGAKKIVDAFAEGIEERFGGATEARINNVSTQFSNLQIAITNAQDAIGQQGFAFALGQAATQITEYITKNEDMVKSIGLGLTKAFLYAKETAFLLARNIEILAKVMAVVITISLARWAWAAGASMAALTMTIGRKLIPIFGWLGKVLKATALLALRHPIIGGIAIAIAGIEYFTGSVSKLATKLGLIGEDSALDALVDGASKLAGTLTNDVTQGLDGILGMSERVNQQLSEITSELEQQADIQTNAITPEIDKQAQKQEQIKKTVSDLLAIKEEEFRVSQLSTDEQLRYNLEKEITGKIGRELLDDERDRLGLLVKQTRELTEQKKRMEDFQKALGKAFEFGERAMPTLYGMGLPELEDSLDLAQQHLENALRNNEHTEEDHKAWLLNLERQFQVEKARMEEAALKGRLRNLMREADAHEGLTQIVLSEKSKQALQAIGQEEKIEKRVNDRIEFEKKSEFEKAQWAVSQGASAFEQLGRYNKQAFQAAKALRIAEAIMNTYTGATLALATYPPPFNFIGAAVVVAAGMANIANIRSQSYSGRQLGGPVQEGKSFLVGETGPEIFTPNISGRIDRMDGMGGQNVNINFNIQAVDTQGFDELLVSRRGVIQQVISDAMLESGQRSRY